MVEFLLIMPEILDLIPVTTGEKVDLRRSETSELKHLL
jgi:hypothetical protein